MVRNRQGQTVILAGRSGWLGLVTPVAVAGGVVYVYIRIKGYRLSDFMYVTRSSLQTLRENMADGLAKVWDELRKAKDEFVQRAQALAGQQRQLMETQAKMDERLERVGTNVDEIRCAVELGRGDRLAARACARGAVPLRTAACNVHDHSKPPRRAVRCFATWSCCRPLRTRVLGLAPDSRCAALRYSATAASASACASGRRPTTSASRSACWTTR